MDQNAINYNPGATDDDGSCAYLDISVCDELNACNYNSNANQIIIYAFSLMSVKLF